jgi:SAM-dependent methyltransferase
MSASPRRLTDQAFWEQEYYWSAGNGERPYKVDLAQPFDRSLADALESWAPVDSSERVLEIGCAPAKWLVFYAERFGAGVEGIEYSEMGVSLSRENLRRCKVEGTIHQADFFSISPWPVELVLSIGFIEHFTDLTKVFARHIEFMAPGGRLVVVVPNFRGLHRVVQAMSDSGYLKRHNTAAMSPALYRSFAEQHGLVLEQLEYIGGVDPSIIRLTRKHPRLHPRRAVPGIVTLAEGQFRRTSLGERLQHRWMSSYLLASFRLPG